MDLAHILLIGGSGTGKSVSFCNMHNTLMDGISLQRDGKEVHLCLVSQEAPEIKLLSDWYMDMLKGTLPVNTAESKEFSFYLTWENQPFCDVRMFDYRGSIRDDQDVPEMEKKEFHAALAHSSILIYLIPGNILKEHQEMLRMKEKGQNRTLEYNLLKESVSTEANHLRNIMTRVQGNDCQAGLREDHPPLLLYVTKSDLLPPGTDVMELLKSFIDSYYLYFQDTQLLGCHSTLGPNVYINEDVTPHVIKDGWEPEGFETPFLLSVAYACSTAGNQWYAAEKTRVEALLNSAKNDRRDAFDQKIPFYKGLFGKKRAIKEKNDQIDACEKEIDRLETALKALPDQNKSRRYAEDIIAYIKEKGFSVLYLDKDRQRRDIRELIL